MRTIPEVAEDIKSILNDIERTQECNGETLVDIDELVNEILTINCYKDEPHTNADRIRSMSDEELYNFIEKAKMCGGLLRTEETSSECRGCDGDFCCNVMQWLQSEVEGSE